MPALCCALLVGFGGMTAAAAEVRFNRDVRPILADHCFQCHGPDAAARKAKLRLDTREGAVADRKEGPAVAPGKPEASSVVARLLSHDPDEVMPPPDLKKPLTAQQIGLVQDWIRQGASYEGHWAYEPIERPAEPSVTGGPAGAAWGRNAIDRFTLARLNARGLSPSSPAGRRTLYRRLSFDLTGLPPRLEDVDPFVADPDPRAYERAVDGFLQSRHFGERMAVFWLDLVRYADTVGYHGDQDYRVSPYRDYVIQAFNQNLPFNQFTRENLAGDLLPGATRDQRVASGYNRLLMITAEGGAQDREYRAKYAADRVRNASTVWLGVTLGCAECHDHKYDPFSTRDFYSFSAFFADLKEEGFYGRGYPAGDWGPAIKLPDERQSAEQARLRGQQEALERLLNTSTPELTAAQQAWEQGLLSAGTPEFGPWQVLGPFAADGFDAAYDRDFGPEKVVDLSATYAEGRHRWVTQPDWKDGEAHSFTGDNSAVYVHRSVRVPADQELALSLGSDDALKLWVNGELVLANKVTRGVAPDQDKPAVRLRAGDNQLLFKVVNGGGGYAFYFKAVGLAPAEILDLVKYPADQRSPEQVDRLARHFRGLTSLLADPRRELADTRKALATLEAELPSTLISEALPEPRLMRVLRRGNWLDDGGEVVEPAVPRSLPQPAATGRRLTRLDLADWMVAPANPLTARVLANRLWKQFFGLGLSRKLEDIGAQGEWPSHPELLDWLASELRDSGWNVKHLVRLLVTSETYRQSSTGSERLREVDPDNRLLARQSAVRLDAEFIRDAALVYSGLLVDRLGGPSSKPYQPPGYYSQLNFPKREYEADRGEGQYRRGLYTHWQRTFLHPSLAAFDAPTREECTAERVRSNTPQQALTLLNDPTYVEAARALAERVLREGGSTPGERLRYAFRLTLARSPDPREAAVLERLQAEHARAYAADPAAAQALLSTGQRPSPTDLVPEELAAWTSVARAILNLHEVITRS